MGVGKAESNPFPILGPLTFHGQTVPGITNGADITTPLRTLIARASAAANAAVANGIPPKAYVILPAGAYQVSETINLPDYVVLKGEGRGSTQISAPSGKAIAVIAIGANVAGLPLSFRPDLFGILDTTAAPSAGVRRGFRTFSVPGGDPGGQIRSMGSALSHGGTSIRQGRNIADHWFESRQVSVDVAFKPTAGGQYPLQAQVVGSGSTTGGPAEFFQLRSDTANNFSLCLSLLSAQFAIPKTLTASYTSGSATGLQRHSFQVDTVAGTLAVFVNGVQVAVTLNAGPISSVPAGSFLNETTCAPWCFNDGGVTKVDQILCGYKVSRGLLYNSGSVGSTQTRVDGTTLNDRVRYFPTNTDDPNCITYLSFNESDPTSRSLDCAAGPLSAATSRSQAWAFGGGGPDGRASFAGIEDITIHGRPGYGYGLMISNALEASISGVWIEGGMYGVGNLPSFPNYNHYFFDCRLAGDDSAYFGSESIVQMDRITITRNGLVALRLHGTNYNGRNIFVSTGTDYQQAFMMDHAGDYGGGVTLENVLIDDENVSSYNIAGIYSELNPSGKSVILRNIGIGPLAPGIPTIKLRQFDPSYANVGVIDANNVHGVGGYLIDSDGLWRGRTWSCYQTPGNTPAARGAGASLLTIGSWPP